MFQVEEPVFSPPNHRGRRLQAIGAGVEHTIPNTEIHGLRNEEYHVAGTLRVYHHINQPRKRVDVVEMGKKCVENSRNG